MRSTILYGSDTFSLIKHQLWILKLAECYHDIDVWSEDYGEKEDQGYGKQVVLD